MLHKNKTIFAIRYIACSVRTWYQFHFKWPWVKYKGFVRVMSGTGFAKCNIELGNRVQFGKNCKIITNLHISDSVLIASNVSFVGRHDHTYNVPGQYIWDSPRGNNGTINIERDVWIGHGSIIVGPVNIGAGSIIAAGSVLTKDVGECEIWGGVPAQKIKDRFNEQGKIEHLKYLNKSK